MLNAIKLWHIVGLLTGVLMVVIGLALRPDDAEPPRATRACDGPPCCRTGVMEQSGPTSWECQGCSGDCPQFGPPQVIRGGDGRVFVLDRAAVH